MNPTDDQARQPAPRQVSDTDAAEFEAAMEILTQLVGLATQQIAKAQQLADPDPAAITTWTTRRDEWLARSRDLSPGATAAVRTVLQEDGHVLQTLREEAG